MVIVKMCDEHQYHTGHISITIVSNIYKYNLFLHSMLCDIKAVKIFFKLTYQFQEMLLQHKKILRRAYLHNGICFTGKTTYRYWIKISLHVPFSFGGGGGGGSRRFHSPPACERSIQHRTVHTSDRPVYISNAKLVLNTYSQMRLTVSCFTNFM